MPRTTSTQKIIGSSYRQEETQSYELSERRRQDGVDIFEGLTPQQAADAAIKLFNNYTDSCDYSSSGKEKAEPLIN